jgi:hypothetical protein
MKCMSVTVCFVSERQIIQPLTVTLVDGQLETGGNYLCCLVTS